MNHDNIEYFTHLPRALNSISNLCYLKTRYVKASLIKVIQNLRGLNRNRRDC